MERMKEDCILEAIFKLRTENTEMHDGIMDYFINQYDEYSQSSEDDVLEGVKDFSKEMEYEWADQLENMDRKPAATIDPMKTSHLSNPFNKYAFLETLNIPVIAELNIIGQGTPRSTETGIPTQTIVDRTGEVVQSDIMTHLVTELNQMSLKSKSFPFHKKKSSTLMFATFLEAFLTGNRHVRK